MRILIFALLVLPFITFAQKTYAPLNATWNYEGWEINCNGNHLEYKVENEITVQGNDCSVIYAYYADNNSTSFTKALDSLVVWEDQDKVYFLEDTTFYLLYDFAANVGDTISYYNPVNRGFFSTSNHISSSNIPIEGKLVVTNVELKTIDNQQRKFFTTDYVMLSDTFCMRQGTIIENIGSTSQGLLGELCIFVADGCFGGLQCYENSSIEYQTDQQFETPNPNCDTVNAMANISASTAINVFPNPTYNIVHIETERNYETIQLLNIEGRVVHVFDKNDQIQLATFNSGIYFLRIIDHDFSQTLKVVKQ